jgi:MoaA/NifB/PqqE/SkfB family radical SAM enzyme
LNILFQYLHHKFDKHSLKWHPFIAFYYLTYECHFRCPYCSNGAGKPFYSLAPKSLPVEGVTIILRQIRKYCDYIVITGGEPLNHGQFDDIMHSVKDLGFKNVVLTTNGYDLDKYAASVKSSVSTVSLSLDTLNYEKADAWYGVGDGALKKILNNVDSVLTKDNKKIDVIVSSVVTSENINDLYDVYDYAKRRGFSFAACPELVGVKAHESLIDNMSYKDFYNFLIDEKIKGGNIFGTVKYLQYMRDLKKFTCHPFTMLVIAPTGEVYYPCLERGNLVDNIVSYDNLHDMRAAGFKKYGPPPLCDNRCHSACALSFALILKYPSTIFHEGYLIAKQKIV